MTLRRDDIVQLKFGGRPEHARVEGGPRILSLYAAKFPTGQTFRVTSPATPLGNVGVQNHSGLVAAIHSDQLRRVFRGGFVEGDQVRVPEASVYGRVVDRDPVAKVIDRKETVPILVESIPPSAAQLSGLSVGAVFYAEPEYIQKTQAPLVLGGQGGAGGSAFGVGAVGGNGGAGGSAHVYVTTAHDNAGLNKAAGILGLEVQPKPEPAKPKYADVTEGATWKNLQVGDIVTAEHKTRHVNGSRIARGAGIGAEVTVSRTSEVVSGVYGKYWCELELGLSSYDAYKITKVLRPQRQRTLVERRKPIQLTIDRIVPANHVWNESRVRASAAGVVEKHVDDGDYWLYFTDGKHAGKRIRLKEGRDTVSYEAVAGRYVVREDFEELQLVTHDKE